MHHASFRGRQAGLGYLRFCQLGILANCWLVMTVSLAPADDPQPVRLQHIWEADPDLGELWTGEFSLPPFEPDLVRLESGQDEYRLTEARRIVQSGRQLDEAGQQAVRATLIRVLEQKPSKRNVQLALVSAWCEIFDADSADVVWGLVQGDATVRDFFESVLIAKQHDAAKDTWLARVQDPSGEPRQLLNAIDGLAACGASEGAESLEAIIRSDQASTALKLTASKALGELATAGLEALSSEWLASNRTLKEMVAANLLVNHDSPAAQDLINQLVGCGFAPAEVTAYAWFARWRPERAHQLAAEVLDHPDNSMRLAACKVLHQFDEPEDVRLQATLLSDSNITLRRTIRDHLIEKAQNPALRTAVDESISLQLSGERFEGIEQAILVVVAIQDKDRCSQFVQLLDHPRPEVSIRAAWALQQLAEDPQDLADILKHCEQWTDWLEARTNAHPVKGTDIFRLSYLFGALGRNEYAPADAMLRAYVPKNLQMMRPITRIAAVWALGKIWKNRMDSGLEQPLIERILDMSVTEPEEDTVRYTAALSLGRIGNPVSIAPLKGAPFSSVEPVGVGIAWAIEQIEAKQSKE